MTRLPIERTKESWPRCCEECTCWRCTAQLFGEWLDQLGSLTPLQRWAFFLTITFSTPDYPWRKGFPMMMSKPHPDFAHDFFRFFVSHFEAVLEERIDYVVADQFGGHEGRFHQHALLAGESLDDGMRRPLECFLHRYAGYCRALPFERGAAFYLSRFIGRSVRDCEWDVRIGNQEMAQVREPAKWGNVVVASAEMPKAAYHQGLPGRRR
jgi:hypothetical protein